MGENEKKGNDYQKVPTTDDETNLKSLFGIRHVQAVLLFLAMVLAFAMRVNMSIAIVAMTDSNNENSFSWNLQVQSYILSSFFFGYIVLQIPSGELSRRFGGKVLITILVGVNSVVTLLIPLSASYGGWRAVCACRVLQGLTQGFLYPTMHTLLCQWAPLEEKGRIGTFIYAGGQLGNAGQLIASGFIADYWGWPAIFYVVGSAGVLWTVAYIALGADSPRKSKMISMEERRYIQHSLGQENIKKKYKTPWKSILTSVPFIALILANCGQTWGYWTLMTEMPSYMRKVLDVDIKANGVMSALPYIAKYIASFPVGYMSDLIIAKKWMSVSATRKLSNSIGFYGPGLALVGLSYVPPGNVALAVGLLTLVLALNAGHLAGYMLVHTDMAPNFAGILMGITNFTASFMSIIAPIVAGAVIKDETDPNEWRKVFFISSAIFIIGNTCLVIFGTCERQKWNEPINENQVVTGGETGEDHKTKREEIKS